MNIKVLTGSLLIGVGCAVVGFFGYTTLKHYNGFLQAQDELRRAYGAISSNIMLYGVLRSYDSNSATLEIEIQNPYQVGGPAIIYRLPLLASAFIGYQEVTAEDGVYTSVSSTTPLARETLTQLPAGTRVKFLTLPRDTGSAIMYLLVGNPL